MNEAIVATDSTRGFRSTVKASIHGIRLRIKRRHKKTTRASFASFSGQRKSGLRLSHDATRIMIRLSQDTSKARAASFSSSSSSLSPSASSCHRNHHRQSVDGVYSISFFPWKMEPHVYYSHPEAAITWVPDTASSRCQICLIAFSLTRRRHHCRLCGQLVCRDCSMQRTYFPFASTFVTKDRHRRRRKSHRMIKDGVPQRTCNACGNTLGNMAAQRDPRVRMCTGDKPDQAVLDPETSVAIVKPKHTSRTTELEMIMQARSVARGRSAPTQYVISAQWLEQWLDYVQVESPAQSKASACRKRMLVTSTKRPGPITNYALLDFVNGKLVPKQPLERSRGHDMRGGDYRVITEQVWHVFYDLYGGGPSIRIKDTTKTNHHTMVLSRTSSQHDGLPLNWSISELNDQFRSKSLTNDALVQRNTTSISSLHQRHERSRPRSESKSLVRATTATGLSSRHPSTGFQLKKSSSLSDILQPDHDQLDDEQDALHASQRSYTTRPAQVTRITEGTVLFDPDDLQAHDPRETMAAVSAFALAAAQARKKSAMSLSRHSAVFSASRLSTTTA